MKRLLKKLLSVSLGITLICGTVSLLPVIAPDVGVSANAAETLAYEDYEYIINDDDTITITKYQGCNSIVEIPNIINGRTVKVLGDEAFISCKQVKDVTIPNSISKIGHYVFKNCSNLNKIVIPNSVTEMGQGVFYKCTNLEDVKLSNKLSTLENYLFLGCEKLISIVIPDSIVRIEWGVFSNCITLDNITIPSNVQKIGGCAFRECTNLKKIKICNGVIAIDGGAFQLCTSLNSVFIPASVENIDANIFYKCDNLSCIQIDDENNNFKSLDGVMYDKSVSKLISFPPNKEGSYVVPDSVTEICASSCAYCKKLTSIAISKKIKYIGDSAFTDCYELEEVIISETDNYAIIYPFAFYNCPKLKTVYVPDGVCQINYNAFGYAMSKYGNTKVEGFTITGKKNSIAEEYANKNDLYFIVVSERLENQSEISSKIITLGKTITINGKAIGGFGDYTYAVYYKKAIATKWSTKQKFSSNDTVEIKPAATGKYDVLVKVKDSNGDIAESTFTFDVFKILQNKSTVLSENIGLGNVITVQAAGTGGLGTYTYAVYYKRAENSKWTLKQNYDTNSTITIKPAKDTTYDVCVKIKDERNVFVKKYFKVNVTKPENTSTVASDVINLGKTIDVNCSATGGTAPYQYAVYYKKTKSENWSTKQSYSANNAVSIKPASRTSYDVCVRAKDSFGNVSKKYFTVNVK